MGADRGVRPYEGWGGRTEASALTGGGERFPAGGWKKAGGWDAIPPLGVFAQLGVLLSR